MISLLLASAIDLHRKLDSPKILFPIHRPTPPHRVLTSQASPDLRDHHGTIPSAHATDNGVALVDEGTTLAEGVAENPDAYAYEVRREADGFVTETVITPRLLSRAIMAEGPVNANLQKVKRNAIRSYTVRLRLRMGVLSRLQFCRCLSFESRAKIAPANLEDTTNIDKR